MRRLRFMTLLGSGAAVWYGRSRRARSKGPHFQQLAFCTGCKQRSETADAFIQRLKDAGYIERRTSERLQKSGLGAEYTRTA